MYSRPWKAGTPPQFAYAYRKTGLLFSEEARDHWPPDRVQEWEDAVAEYFAIQDATAGVNKPDPEEWSTEPPRNDGLRLRSG